MGLLGEPHFPVFWISSLRWLLPQPLRNDGLEQIRGIQWRRQSKHKGNLPSSAPQSDKNTVPYPPPFFSSSEYLDSLLKLGRAEGEEVHL